MQTFVWSEEFYTGIGVIDEQHHDLVDLFNKLSDALIATDESGEAAVHSAFMQLMEYAQHHFALEEALMRSSGVAQRHVTMHLRLHDEFGEQVRAMWSARAQQPGGGFSLVSDVLAVRACAWCRSIAGTPD